MAADWQNHHVTGTACMLPPDVQVVSQLAVVLTSNGGGGLKLYCDGQDQVNTTAEPPQCKFLCKLQANRILQHFVVSFT